MPTQVRVGPELTDPSHHISLTNGRRTYGLFLPDESKSIREVPMTPSTILAGGGGGKFGDDEPGMHHSAQDDWSGGRGSELFSDDPQRYFDGQNCWTLTPNYLLPGPLITTYSGFNVSGADSYMPGVHTVSNHGDVGWTQLLGSKRYISAPRSGTSTLVVDVISMLVRRVGSPGTLTFEIRTDDAGLPSTTVQKTSTKTVSDITDTVAQFVQFDFTGTESLTGSSVFHLVIYGASTDSVANHWEIGCDLSATTTGGTSSNGTTWAVFTAANPYWTYFLLTSAVYNSTRMFLFELDGSLYAVDKFPDGATATTLYLNGTRGKATSATSTTL